MNIRISSIVVLSVALAQGCTTPAEHDLAGDSATSGTGSSAAVRNCSELFNQRVQRRLEYCRTCHVPGGVGDVEDGRLFLLSNDRSRDLDLLELAWENLGGNDDGPNRILRMASGTDSRSHSGGQPWPVGSNAYRDMSAQLSGFEDAAACVLDGATGVGDDIEELALLGSRKGGHVWFDFCEADEDGNPRPDSAQLPTDPRELVQPGTNIGKAVHFNFHWKDCRVDPELVGEQPHPKTCGELRTAYERGATLMRGNGVPGQGAFFAGNEPNGYAAITAEQYNNLWQQWGLSERPDNFDVLVAERYGVGANPVRNPYPVPLPNGELEDPNATNGGSGQLPYGYLQTRNADGSWSSNITNNCQACHTIDIDGEMIVGGGGALFDAGVISRDAAAAGNAAGGFLSASGLGGRTRGTNTAQFTNVAAAASVADPNQVLSTAMSGSTGSGDTPAWWNVGSRPLKFVDAAFSGDGVRADMAFFTPLLDKRPVPSSTEDRENWIRDHAYVADTYITAVKAPEWPADRMGAIDTALAEQGAILFHAKNLWDAALNNPFEQPEGGNGSCASCHGAYAPRFVHDPAYLDTPALEGIASNVTPLALIGTDPVHIETYDEGTNQALSNTIYAYPETMGSDAAPDDNPVQDCGTQNEDRLRGDREIGYAAPPLYGIWATAPYFHNGSVPNVWQVLDPAARPQIWRRVSRPTPPELEGQAGIIMGYDTDTQRAYDAEVLGWRYDDIQCGSSGTNPYFDCNPTDPNGPTAQPTMTELYGNILLGNSVTIPRPFTDQQIEDRKVYNTNITSQGNGGHEFTSVLTDQERRALIEYLKTL